MVNLRPQGHANGFMRVRPTLPWPPPRVGDCAADIASRKISSKVWELAEIKELARKYSSGDDNAINVVTNDCAIDLQRENLEKADLAEFIELVLEKHYLNSAWCMASQRPGVTVPEEARWYPCDAYCMDIVKTGEDARTIEKKYYIKMCKTATGKMLLIISMHESNN